MEPAREIRNIALIGFMGTGKTSVGHNIAGLLNFQFVDTDELIERKAGKRIAEIFSSEGEEHFRAYEREVLSMVDAFESTVISTGGGLGANLANLTHLKKHALAVCLWASAEAIWERVKHQTHRPLLQVPDPLERIRELLAEREPVYRQADVLINTEMRSLKEVAYQVIYQFRLARQNHSLS